MTGFALDPMLPAPTSPLLGIAEDGVPVYGEMDDAYVETIPGINPATGEPDGRYDGRITAAAPIRRAPEAAHPEPDPNGLLVAQQPRASELVIARELGVGLADIYEQERLRRQATEARRAFDPRSLR